LAQIRDARVQVGRVALETKKRDGRRVCPNGAFPSSFFGFRASIHAVHQIITNVFVQFIILLYLIDNNDNTSWMILFGSGTGVLIEAWKVLIPTDVLFRSTDNHCSQITKAVDISVVAAPAGSLLPYKLDIKGS
jgi:hypothetical protein